MSLDLEDVSDATSAEAEKVRQERAGESSRASGTGSGQRGKKRGPYKKRGSSRASAAPEAPEREPYKPTEESVAAASLMVATVWKIAGPMLKLDALTRDEADELGRATDPILAKYVPLLNDWRDELTLAVAVAGAFEVTRKRYRDKHPEQFRPKGEPDDGPVRDLGEAEVVP